MWPIKLSKLLHIFDYSHTIKLFVEEHVNNWSNLNFLLTEHEHLQQGEEELLFFQMVTSLIIYNYKQIKSTKLLHNMVTKQAKLSTKSKEHPRNKKKGKTGQIFVILQLMQQYEPKT